MVPTYNVVKILFFFQRVVSCCIVIEKPNIRGGMTLLPV